MFTYMPALSTAALPKNKNENGQPNDRMKEKRTSLQTVLTTIQSSTPNATSLKNSWQSFLNKNSIRNNTRDVFRTHLNQASVIVISFDSHLTPLITANCPLRRSLWLHGGAPWTSPRAHWAFRSDTELATFPLTLPEQTSCTRCWIWWQDTEKTHHSHNWDKPLSLMKLGKWG